MILTYHDPSFYFYDLGHILLFQNKNFCNSLHSGTCSERFTYQKEKRIILDKAIDSGKPTVFPSVI